MTEYHPLIQRAVDGLAKSNADARRALYERARTALVAQLRSVNPALSEAEITKERLALEEAIRKVEAEAARKALGEPRTLLRAEPPADQRAASPISRSFTPERKLSSAGPAKASRRQRPANEPPAAERPLPQRAETLRQEPQRPEPVAAPAADAATQAAPAALKQTARSRILSARTTSLKPDGFRNIVNEVDQRGAPLKAAQPARDVRDSDAQAPRQRTPQVEGPTTAAPFDEHPLQPARDDPLPLHAREPDYGLQDQGSMPPARGARAQSPRAAGMDQADDLQPRPLRSYSEWARIVVFVIIVGAVAAAAWHYRASFAKVYHFVAQLKSQPANQAAQTTTPPPPKFSGRVPQEPAPGEAAPVAGATASTQQPPQVAKRAVLLEQDPNDPQGKRFPGSVIWRTETVSPGPGLAPELQVRADIVIPERHMAVTLSLRRNTDKALPASHTIQIMFNLPPDFPADGVSSVPGIFAKNAEEATGTPLAGISVKVTDNYFLLGLSADPMLQQRNVQLLKDQKWFDIAIVYKNNAKAILAVERGPTGDRAFTDAFSAWGQ